MTSASNELNRLIKLNAKRVRANKQLKRAHEIAKQERAQFAKRITELVPQTELGFRFYKLSLMIDKLFKK